MGEKIFGEEIMWGTVEEGYGRLETRVRGEVRDKGNVIRESDSFRGSC